MKKILGGILGTVAIFAIVGGSAFALFTSQATVNGITLTTDTASLLVSIGGPFSSSINAGVTDNLTPGETPPPVHFQLQNNSDEVDMNVSTQLTSATGDWAVLSPLITATIWVDTNNDGFTTGEESTIVTGTLANWNAGDIPLLGGPLLSGATRNYGVMYSLSASAGNEAQGKTLSDITFVFTGTQVAP